MTYIFRLTILRNRASRKDPGIASAVFVIAIEPKSRTVKFIRSALCNGVNNTAGRATEFCRVVRRVYLKLANSVLADRGTNTRTSACFRKEGLIVVAAIYSAVVQQTGNSTEADQSESAVGCGSGGTHHETRRTPAIDRKFADRDLIYICRTCRVVIINDRRFGSDV